MVSPACAHDKSGTAQCGKGKYQAGRPLKNTGADLNFPAALSVPGAGQTVHSIPPPSLQLQGEHLCSTVGLWMASAVCKTSITFPYYIDVMPLGTVLKGSIGLNSKAPQMLRRITKELGRRRKKKRKPEMFSSYNAIEPEMANQYSDEVFWLNPGCTPTQYLPLQGGSRRN